MKIFGLVCGLLVTFSVVAGNPSSQNWHQGELVLLNEQTVNGEFSYDAFTDLIQVKDERVVKVYSARQVRAFGYFDEKSNQMRRFLSLSYPVRRNRNQKAFFEIVLTGEMYLLRRLHNMRSSNPTQLNAMESDSPWYDKKNAYEYFVYANDHFIPISQFRRRIYPILMKEYKEQLEVFIKDKKLNIYTQRGKFMLINQYNVLKSPDKISLF
ncbi:hypothetical protein [Xanthocytophaga agilis]|uniref:Uncharacterized protein n=1 Tax=Xanthocytophaga agilis TaxID=3048010 RepID=A0AAE3R6E6_9BACT|nr:hypothetical protein [Xanthocytophaga agilis]MDJ1501638.1 hypothetical protein [Xanthocytophaga agilis]